MSDGEDRVWVALERDESGYPPWEEEWLWAERVGHDQFRVLAAPTFVRGLSVYDVVHAVRFEGRWFVDRVVASSGYSTVRVILFRDDRHDTLLRVAQEHGCDPLHTEIPGLFAIVVPPACSVVGLLRDLRVHASRGDWDIDEASIAPGHDWIEE